MPTIEFQGVHYKIEGNESVLDCLLRHGVPINSSCREGICQTCLMKSMKGRVPGRAQAGLKITQREQNFFLACICKPQNDLVISQPNSNESSRIKTTVIAKEILNKSIVRLRLLPAEPTASESPFEFRAGQFINIYRHDNTVRSYSIASTPSDKYIELHISWVPNGLMSSWLLNEVNINDQIEIEGPFGNCFYMVEDLSRPLLLIGTGTGLAPLFGIIRDALQKTHNGPIHLYHGSRFESGIYLHDTLLQMENEYPNFHYTACVDEISTRFVCENAAKLALEEIKSLKGWNVYLCGNPDMVADMKRKTFLAGASLQNVFADPFIYGVSRDENSGLLKKRQV